MVVTDLTDAPIKIDDEPAPELIATHYLSSVDELSEYLRAANLLGLGVGVRSYLQPDEDGDGFSERWELDLLTASPVYREEAAVADAAL